MAYKQDFRLGNFWTLHELIFAVLQQRSKTEDIALTGPSSLRQCQAKHEFSGFHNVAKPIVYAWMVALILYLC